jgi:hypothetical protein
MPVEDVGRGFHLIRSVPRPVCGRCADAGVVSGGWGYGDSYCDSAGFAGGGRAACLLKILTVPSVDDPVASRQTLMLVRGGFMGETSDTADVSVVPSVQTGDQ